MQENFTKKPSRDSERVFETIRNALLAIPGIIEAEVKVHQSQNGEQELVGFAIIKHASLTPETVMNKLRKTLSANQLPDRIILVFQQPDAGLYGSSTAA